MPSRGHLAVHVFLERGLDTAKNGSGCYLRRLWGPIALVPTSVNRCLR